MADENRMLAGQCLCGNVHYRVEDAFEYALNCHCSQCRRATGSAFKPFGGVRREKLMIEAGEDRLMRYGGSGDADHDVRCGECGSLLWSVVRGGQYAHVTYGSLMDAPSLKISAHIFAGSKAAWEEITDDLPQHEGFG